MNENLDTPFENPLVVQKYTTDVRDGLYEFESSFLKISNVYSYKSPRFLCLGCGAGREVFPLAELGCDVLGIDGSSKLIAAANAWSYKKRSKATFRYSMLPPLPDDIGSFTCVIATYNFLSHISDISTLRMLLLQVYNHLEPTGKLIITFHERKLINNKITPHGGIGELKRIAAIREKESPALDFRFFTKKEIFRILQNVGFCIERDMSILELVPPQYPLKWSRSIIFASAVRNYGS
jgi:SAM-dependent methyltransferase